MPSKLSSNLRSASTIVLIVLASYGYAVTQLSDGTHIEYGSTDLAPGLGQWQASGILTRGCTVPADIDDCYGINLSSDPSTNIDEHFAFSPRQRMEFRTSYHNKGTRFYFTWKQYFPTSLKGSPYPSSFFHIMQIFNVDIDYPVLTLDVSNNTLKINDMAGDKCQKQCPYTSLDYYSGTTIHAMDITFGPNGRIDYGMWDSYSGETILEYHGSGNLGGNSSYLKYGFYRSTYPDMSPIYAAVGDFYSERIYYS